MISLFVLLCSLVASSSNPYLGRPDAVMAGRKLFRYHCADCHGLDAKGTASAPSLRSPRIQDSTPDVLFRVLTNGRLKHGMPSWSRLPDERRWQIVTYLLSLESAAHSDEPRRLDDLRRERGRLDHLH
jgi:mono/diheme cytochrome c family protein